METTQDVRASRRPGTNDANRSAWPYAAATFVTILWSSSFVLVKWGLTDIPPLYFATLRYALAFFLWNWTLKAIPASELSVLQDLMLVEIAPFALVFLDETMSLLMAVGIALVLAGVAVVQLKARGDHRITRNRPQAATTMARAQF